MVLPKAWHPRRGRGVPGSLLGAVTLETLGLVPAPLTRPLVPMRLLLSTMQAGGRPVSRPRA